MMKDSRSILKTEELVKSTFGADSKVYKIFKRCFEDTIARTVFPLEDGTCFIITGDIPAMWLRDSSCQFRPYVMLAKEDSDIRNLIIRIIKRQLKFILTDPYANAFNKTPNGLHFLQDQTFMLPEVWERKYELDSMCFPFQLSYLLWKNSGETIQFDENWIAAADKVITVMKIEQEHQQTSTYRFIRNVDDERETLSRNGLGNKTKDGLGLVWSGFRPSDDACIYGYNIPQNMLASATLSEISEISEEIVHAHFLAMRARKLSAEIKKAVEKYGIVSDDQGYYYCYELDGYGNYLTMDDANVPSLLSAPYIGFCDINDKIYQHTREIILSEKNPYYYRGNELFGIGSSHTKPGRVWPIALAIQGLTAQTQREKGNILNMLINSDNDTYMMHEAVDVNDVSQYSRRWFSWANALYCELVLDYCGKRIHF